MYIYIYIYIYLYIYIIKKLRTNEEKAESRHAVMHFTFLRRIIDVNYYSAQIYFFIFFSIK